MRRPARWSALLAVLLLASATALSEELRELRVEREGDRYRLEMRVWLDAEPAAVWRVLTDFGRLSELSPSVLESRVVGRADDGRVRVFSRSRVCVWMLCRNLRHMQWMSASPTRRLGAEMIPGESDFLFGSGLWTLQAEGGGTLMAVRVEVEPAFWIPPLIGPWAIRRAMHREALLSSRGIERLAR